MVYVIRCDSVVQCSTEHVTVCKISPVLVHLDLGGGAELWGLVWTHVSIYAGCLYCTYGLLPGTP